MRERDTKELYVLIKHIDSDHVYFQCFIIYQRKTPCLARKH